MGWRAVKDNLDYLAAQHQEGDLRWHKGVVDVFGKLLGSGYIPGAIRSLWPLCHGPRQTAVGYLLELAERWRDELRNKHALEARVNEEFLKAARGLIDYAEGEGPLPSSKMFVIENGALRWNQNSGQPTPDEAGGSGTV